MMTCRDAMSHLDAYRTGELPTGVRTEMAAHLAECQSCAATLSGIEALAARMPSLRLQAPSHIRTSILDNAGDRYGSVETDLGRLWVGFNARGITMIHLGSERATAFERTFERRLGRRPHPADVPDRYARAVQRAASGQAPSKTPVSLEGLSQFEQQVLRILATIPHGEVRPYAWLAKEAGRPKAARAVGTVMARNPVPFLLPCHRVVPSTGGVGNYGFGSAMKRELLRREGVLFEDLEAWATDHVRYIGCQSTGIYCFPTCRDARRVQAKHRLFFADARTAQDAGYRPCQHCRPLTA